uniref:ArnT family glycosyltransferase n=1 Tax=Streptomyces monomycini TaxID=371720 RepID=UPI0014320F95
MAAKPPFGLPVSPPSPPSAASPTRPAPISPPAQRTPSPQDITPRRRPRRRWEVWRSPEGQPRWARPALLGVAALAALLYAWNITTSGLAPYYSVAARSMTESWKAFLFTAYDPSATITLDKIGGFLWPQALSARLFGFHDWALTLPQCVEGVVSVLVLYRVVRRWQGPATGLLAAGLLTLTPVAASLFGHPIPDAALIMCLVLAVDRYQLAARGARLRSLVWAGVWVGLAFQAKMMQAWLVVPALAVGYLVTAPVTARARIGHLLTAGAVLFAVSFSWVLMMTFTPKDVRPYADGSTNNSALSMVFQYNGFSRPADSGPGGPGGAGGPGGPGGFAIQPAGPTHHTHHT